MDRELTIIKIRKPGRGDLNEELQWFGTSLGLFSLRDKDRSCFRIFIELLKTTKDAEPMSSDEIAYRLRLSRGTVIHHINKLKKSGIVSSERNRYYLRTDSLSSLVGELEKDMKRMYEDLKEAARGIDIRLGRN